MRQSTPSPALPGASDTIAAIATPAGIGGIGIVRISGPDAQRIGQVLFRDAHGAAVQAPPSHQMLYGHVIDPATGETVDEVLAAFLRAPRAYTREDTVELHAHGSPLVLRRIVELALAAGARAANPGEMTLRAFLNGRMDLAQAEAVMALIASESDAGRRLAMLQLQGALSARVHAARDAALAALASIEASIDFPEEEVPAPEPAQLGQRIAAARTEVATLLAGADRGRILREGLRVALVGRPNVGKSSLLNALLRTERAIVTPVPGTTRDTIEERALIGGIALHLIDTAGLTPSAEAVERAGVERSRQAARSADLLLLVLDGAEPLAAADEQAVAELRALDEAAGADPSAVGATANASGIARALILVLNKADLPPVVAAREAEALWPGAPLVCTSTRTGAGLDALEETIATLVLGGQARAGDALVSSARHRDALRRAQEHLTAAGETLARGLPLDFSAIDLRAALDALGEITGETATADLLDRIFAEFCIGK